MNEKELRFLADAKCIELRDSSSGPGILAGHAAVYESVTDLSYYREVIRRGAFARALKEEQDTRALWNHNTGQVLGRRSANTLRLSEDSVGLQFELDLPDTTVGRDAAVSIRRDDVTGMSFGFRAVKARWVEDSSQDKELRELLDLDLIEISPVTFPAYPDTDVGVRSLDQFRAQKAGTKQQRMQRLRRLRYSDYELTRRISHK